MAGMPWTYAVLVLAAAAFAWTTIMLQELQQVQELEQHLEQVMDMRVVELMDMGIYAMMMLLWGLVQMLIAAMAIAATRRVSTVLAQLLCFSSTWIIVAVLAGVADLMAGRCLSDSDGMYVFRLLFIGGLVIAL